MIVVGLSVIHIVELGWKSVGSVTKGCGVGYPFIYCCFLLGVDRPIVGSVSLIIKGNAKV